MSLTIGIDHNIGYFRYHPQHILFDPPLPAVHCATFSIYCVVLVVFSLETSGLVMIMLGSQSLSVAFIIVSGISLAQIFINLFYIWSVWRSRGLWREDWHRELIRQLFRISCLLVDLLAIAAFWAILALTTGLSVQVHTSIIAKSI